MPVWTIPGDSTATEVVIPSATTAQRHSSPPPRHFSHSSSSSHRVAVYVDWPAGLLPFYIVGTDSLHLLRTFSTTFTEPLHPGFGFWFWFWSGSTVSLCSQQERRVWPQSATGEEPPYSTKTHKRQHLEENLRTLAPFPSGSRTADLISLPLRFFTAVSNHLTLIGGDQAG